MKINERTWTGNFERTGGRRTFLKKKLIESFQIYTEFYDKMIKLCRVDIKAHPVSVLSNI